MLLNIGKLFGVQLFVVRSEQHLESVVDVGPDLNWANVSMTQYKAFIYHIYLV